MAPPYCMTFVYIVCNTEAPPRNVRKHELPHVVGFDKRYVLVAECLSWKIEVTHCLSPRASLY